MGSSSSKPTTTVQSNGSGNLNSNMLLEREGDVLYKYEVIKVIGEGSMGSVSKAKIRDGMMGGSAYQTESGCFGLLCPQKPKTNVVDDGGKRRTDNLYALKTIILSRVSADFIEELRNEIAILRSLDHPNIVKAYEVFEKKTSIYIVMELCSGGDLYRRLPYSEKQAAKITTKLVSAIKYMHDHDVVHRDLKFENIMFENSMPESEIKVIDFGLSKKFLPSERVRTMSEGVGTIYTMAPQVLQGVYTSQADLWSAGVITYMLLSSQKPFYHKRRKRVIDKIMRGSYNFSSVLWDQVTEDSKDFVSKLLVVDPKSRMNAAQALKHAWLEKQFALSDRRPTEELMNQVQENLLAYKDTSDLKKLALNVIAHKSSTEEIIHLREAFDQYDKGNDGYITFVEFKEALETCNYGESDIQEIFESIDVNQNGHIMYREFLAATLEARGDIEEERIAEAFDRLDSDDSGFISKANLRSILGKEWSAERIDDLIREVDANRDGKISFDEFKVLFRKTTNGISFEVAGQDTFHESEAELMGIDSFIPGGKYDKQKSTASD